MKKNITVLLTGAGAPGAPGIINCYKHNGERNIRIVGVDANPNAAGKGLVDAFYPVPPANDPAFISSVLEICAMEKVDIVIPIVTRELEHFSRNKKTFEAEGIKVSVMDFDTLRIVNDKGNLLDAMKAEGIPTAEYLIAETSEQLFSCINKLGYPENPVCVKATIGNGSRGVRIIEVEGDGYDRFFNEKPNSSFISYSTVYSALNGRDIPRMMVMEYLPGDEYSVDVLSDKGRIITMVCRKGTKVVSSIQVESVIVENHEIAELCSEVVNKIHISGVFGFDVKCDKNGKPRVIEINPRLTAGIVACAAAGCNIPYLELLRQLGEPIPEPKTHYGVVMTRHWEEIFYDADGSKIDW